MVNIFCKTVFFSRPNKERDRRYSTPILKLAMVKRFRQKNSSKKIIKKIRQKDSSIKFVKRIRQKNSSKKFVKKIRQKNSSKISTRNPKEPKIIQILKGFQCFSLDHREKKTPTNLGSSKLRSSGKRTASLKIVVPLTRTVVNTP
jgi:hypothetical protein